MSGSPPEKEMAAACMVHPYEASQILGVREEHRPNGIPLRESLREQFTFTAQDLHAFILETPMRAGEITNRALNNRASPAPYIWNVGNGFHVGWYDGPPGQVHDVFFHQHIDEAAADFVLAYWGLPRLPGTPVPDRAAGAIFQHLYPAPENGTRLQRIAADVRRLIEKWIGC